MGGKCGPYIYGTMCSEEEYLSVTLSLYIYITNNYTCLRFQFPGAPLPIECTRGSNRYACAKEPVSFLKLLLESRSTAFQPKRRLISGLHSVYICSP